MSDTARRGASPSRSIRRSYIDWARAIAVLVMIEAHMADAWLRTAERASPVFGWLMLVGGFAAPLFLWLAGLGLVLSAERRITARGDRAAVTSAIVKRGVEIFLLAFLFRLQAFVLTPGGAVITLFRVDILNVMGPSLVVAALIWGAVRDRVWLAIAYSSIALFVAMMTPVARTSPLVDLLPVWTQWYIRPAGEYTTFTMLPWAGFVFAGAAAGMVVAWAWRSGREPMTHLALASAGAAVLILGLYAATLPTIYQASSFWTSSPAYFAVRTGVLMLVFSALFGAEQVLGAWNRALAPLARLGASSLLVYWIHVELIYGTFARPVKRHLSLAEFAWAYLAFCVAMYGVVVFRDAAAAAWRNGRYSGVQPKISPVHAKKPLR